MINNRTPLEVRIPANLDVNSLIPETLKKTKREKYKDGICYFLDLLFPKPFQHKKRDQLQKSGYISLRAPDLLKIIGPEYKIITSWLSAAGVIKIDPHFIPGIKNMGYRITQRYFIETVSVSVTNKGMCERYWKRKSEEQKKRSRSLNSISFVTKWLDEKYIGIDLTGGHNFIETYRLLMLEKWNAYTFTSEDKKTEAKCRILNRYFHQKYVVEKIKKGEFNSKRDDAGRLYTPLVHLKKELRNFVTLDGKRLCSIDIKASQPYFFQKLLDRRFWMTGPTNTLLLYKVHNERYKQLEASGNRKKIITILKNLETRYGPGMDNVPFKNINWEDDFYDHLRSLVPGSTSDPQILNNFSDRSKVKGTVMLLLYDNYESKKTPYYHAFKKLFPDETMLMDAIKYGHSKRVFPTILQAVEAKVVLEHTCSVINERYPELPFVTIHDSVMCDASYAESVAKILRDTLHLSIGIMPGLKVENMDKQTVVQNIQHTVDADWNDIVKDIKKMKEGPDWVGSFNEEPKEIPLLGYFKYNGRIHLDKRMAYPVFEPDYSDYEEDLVENDYPEEYYNLPDEYE